MLATFVRHTAAPDRAGSTAFGGSTSPRPPRPVAGESDDADVLPTAPGPRARQPSSTPRPLAARPPVQQLQHPPPTVHLPQRPARALSHLRRRQLPQHAVLRGGPGPACPRRPRSPAPVGRAHLAARPRGVGLAPAARRHCFNDVPGPRLAPLGGRDLRPPP